MKFTLVLLYRRMLVKPGSAPEALEKVSTALDYGPTTADRMHLYFDRTSFMQGREFITVEAWYFRCAICGLMLPAQRTP